MGDEELTAKLYLRGDCYCVHGEPAALCREILKEPSSARDEYKFQAELLDAVVKGLVMEKKMRVEEYRMVNGKEAKVREASPGNWADYIECLLDNRSISTIAGVEVKKEGNAITVGCAVANTSDRTVKLYQFVDNDIFSNLLYLVYEEHIEEVVYHDILLDKVFSTIEAARHFHKSKRSSRLPVDEGLEESGLAVEAASNLKGFMNLRIDEYEFSRGVVAKFMRMDEAVVSALMRDEVSLEKEIGCATKQGERLLGEYLRNPLVNLAQINSRLDCVDAMLTLGHDVRSILKNIPDLLMLSKRIESERIGVAEIVKIHRAITLIPSLLEVVDRDGARPAFSQEIASLSGVLANLEELLGEIEHTIDVKEEEIRADVNEEVLEICREREAIKTELNKEFIETLESNGLCGRKVRFEESSVYGHHMRVSRVDYHLIKDKSFIQMSTQKSGVMFTTPRLKRLDQECAKVSERLALATSRALSGLRSAVKVFRTSIEVLNHLIAYMDVMSSYGIFSDRNGLTRPSFGEEEYVLEGVHHPLLKTIQRKRMRGELAGVTPNDFSLGASRFCIITGPNMGGKTTFLKTCALVSVMAQAGCFVPASRVRLPIFHSLFIRIGASDYPSRNISTFMAEMIDVSRILNLADARSLVIVDELGRGTSNTDGYSIAHSVCEFLIRKGCVALFATHFQDLCDLGGVVNKKVSYFEEGGRMVMTYKIEDGRGDVSHGINVAKHAGFPGEVVELAERYVREQRASREGAK